MTPDLTGEQVSRSWRTVPWLHRVAVVALVPVFALGFRLFGSR